MVERLKAAIEKARERRGAGGATSPEGGALAPVRGPNRSSWAALPEQALDGPRLRRGRIGNFERNPRINQPFDVLRTRLLKICAANGWRRIGVTSPTKGCGKTMLCANLAFSLARYAETYALVVDLDLRAPHLGRTLGLSADASIVDMLNGAADHKSALVRVGDRLAFGLNDKPVPDASERLQSAETQTALSRMVAALAPTIVIYDLAPMLQGDETIGFLDNLDGVIVVAAAGATTAEQIEECDRLLGDAAPLIGLVLNKCEDDGPEGYQYDYAAA